MKVTTKSGFKCTIDENILRDWRFITLTSKLTKQEDEIQIIDTVNDALNFLLGADGTEKLIEHIAKKHKVADVKEVITEYGEIITILKDSVKKSQSSSE